MESVDSGEAPSRGAATPGSPQGTGRLSSPPVQEEVPLRQVVTTAAGETERKTVKRDRESCYALQLLQGLGRLLGRGGPGHGLREYIRRLDPSWTCTEDRKIPLDDKILETMKNTFWLTRIVFLRVLSLIYFFAFLIAFNQNAGLIGSEGLTPAQDLVEETKASFGDMRGWDRVKAFPSLFLFVPPTDFWLNALALLGMVLSGGVFLAGAASGSVLLLQWMLYLTLVSVGQEWCGFGWDSQLLETGFLGVWISPFWSSSRFPRSWPVPFVCIWGCRWLLLRLYLGTGLSLLRGDSAWRDLSALSYYYQTQPLPSPLAWVLHHQPHSLLVAEAVCCLLVFCVAAFLTVLPSRRCRLIGGLSLMAFGVCSALAGNAAFAPLLALAPALLCLDDCCLSCLFSVKTLGRLESLTCGVGGDWACPLYQGWPLDFHAGEQQQQQQQSLDEEAQALLDKPNNVASENRFDMVGGAGNSPSGEGRRSCCCYYWPDFVGYLKRCRLPRGSVDLVIRHLRDRWWQTAVEATLAAAVLCCAWMLSRAEACAVWVVLSQFFLVLLQSAFSAFVSCTKASFVFTEIVLSAATLSSFSSIFANGPEVWSIWLASCLATVLIIFSYSTLRNAALVIKLHVEFLLLTLFIVLSIPVVQNLLSPQQIPVAHFEPFQVLNTYGVPGQVQRARYELIVQGTDAAELNADTEWKNYEFKCKPTSLDRAPCFLGPYHHRLDWQMHLAAFEDPKAVASRHRWFPQFLAALLKNNSAVTGLLSRNPFHGVEPPTHIRVLRAEYRFTQLLDGIFSRGPWWEIKRGSTEVFVHPEAVPGATEHLQQLLAAREQRQRAEEAQRRAAEEARLRREEAEELQRRLEAARRAAAELKKQQEEKEQREREAEARRQEEAAARKKAAEEEEQKAREKAEKEAAEAAKEAARKAQAEARAQAQAQAEAQRREMERRRQEELEKEKAANEARKREEKRKKLIAEQQKREEEEAKAREAQREKAQRRQQEEQERLKAEAQRQALQEAEKKKKQQQLQQLLVSLTKHELGGVPLRNAVQLSKTAHHRRSSARAAIVATPTQ